MAVSHPTADVLAQYSEAIDDVNRLAAFKRENVIEAVFDGTGRLDGYGLCSLISGLRK